jgi:hypothetical protein
MDTEQRKIHVQARVQQLARLESPTLGKRTTIEDTISAADAKRQKGAESNKIVVQGGLDTRESRTLDTSESNFLRQCSFYLPTNITGKKGHQVEEQEIVNLALEALDTCHMCILHNALSEKDLEFIKDEYADLLGFTGKSAVGEKDSSKRSATRLFNCTCQNEKCDWYGWRERTMNTRDIVGVDSDYPSIKFGQSSNAVHGYQTCARLNAWTQILQTLKFQHVARVEIVTSHVGCRNQAWHVDGDHGLTVIFALADVDLPKGPTQLDFTIPFNSLQEGGGKIKVLEHVSFPCLHVVFDLPHAGRSKQFDANLPSCNAERQCSHV